MKTGPAFPLAYNYKKEGQEYLDVFTGMDLRTYLAGQAMQGLLSTEYSAYRPTNSIVEEAVKYADALIVELNKEQK